MPTRTADAPTRPLRVLMTYRALIPSVRWFGLEQFRQLEAQGKLELRAMPENKLKAADCNWADCVVLTRADTPFEGWLARQLKRMKRKLLYVLDDDLEHVPQGLGCSPYYRDPAVLWQAREIRGCCDVLVTHSPLLEEAYGADFAQVTRISQPAMLTQAQAARNASENRRKERTDAVRIGFSGSEDRAADVQQVLAAPLRALKARYGDQVELVFFGAHPPLIDELKGRFVPYTASAEDYYRTMAEQQLDIGLAPLEDNRFYRSKYYNQFVEYCTYGVPAVYSDLPPYRGVVRNGVDGMLCGTDEWFNALCALIEQPERRAEMARAALKRAEDFAPDKVSEYFWESLGAVVTAYRAPRARLSALALFAARIGCGVLFAIQTLKRRGWSALSIAYKRMKKRRGGRRI